MQYIIQHKGEHGWRALTGYRSKAAAESYVAMLRRQLKQANQPWRGCVRIRAARA